MPYRRNKKTKTRTKNKRTRKNRSRRNYSAFRYNKSGLARGPSPISPKANIPCSMCELQVARNTMFTPLDCLNKHQDKSHKICRNCWWDPNTGFARENAPHGCPGCKKGFPLNPPLKKEQIIDEIIDLTDL